MLDFHTITKKHSEGLIQQIVDTWEHYNSILSPSLLSLEERWEHFISATNDYQSSVCSTNVPTATN